MLLVGLSEATVLRGPGSSESVAKTMTVVRTAGSAVRLEHIIHRLVGTGVENLHNVPTAHSAPLKLLHRTGARYELC